MLSEANNLLLTHRFQSWEEKLLSCICNVKYSEETVLPGLCTSATAAGLPPLEWVLREAVGALELKTSISSKRLEVLEVHCRFVNTGLNVLFYRSYRNRKLTKYGSRTSPDRSIRLILPSCGRRPDIGSICSQLRSHPSVSPPRRRHPRFEFAPAERTVFEANRILPKTLAQCWLQGRFHFFSLLAGKSQRVAPVKSTSEPAGSETVWDSAAHLASAVIGNPTFRMPYLQTQSSNAEFSLPDGSSGCPSAG
ncbi:unnamed protein product [Nesidiocoris tenuis]|uniref:Uncharacterized protein n=1 Tax=Nesidiocoris tenuis TaxID=355587 RepID=A0A6H5HPM6_9HEMI|nr:unnamed protein product [Nesidiocoris tenuis]